MTPRIDTFVQLSDQRRLAYAEYGEPDGAPVLLFHGLPGSRLSWGLLPNDPFPLDLRIIAPDRPGYGNSDPNPRRTLLDWASDVTELANALQLKKFAIVGISGGGPGALACAWKIPDRLTSVGVVACPAPTNAAGVLKGMSKTNRFFMNLAWRIPWLSSVNVRLLGYIIRRNPNRYVNMMSYKVHRADRALLTRPEIQKMLTDDFTEALRGVSSGMVCDLNANHGRPWGFALSEIKTRVFLWDCALDRSVPPAMGEYLSEAIPDCAKTHIPDAGHLWILDHLHEVLIAVQEE